MGWADRFSKDRASGRGRGRRPAASSGRGARPGAPRPERLEDRLLLTLIPASQATSATLPIVPGDGVSIDVYNGIGGGAPPRPSDIASRTPTGSTLSPFIDFPRPGAQINVGQSFNTFFQDTTRPPDQLLGVAASNFILSSEMLLRVSRDLDRNPATPEIDLRLGIGSDDGFHLTVGSTFLGEVGDRGFTYSWFNLEFEDEGLYPVSLLFAANSVGFSGLELAWETATGGGQIIPQSALYLSADAADRLITFEEFPAGTVVDDEYRPVGAVFATTSGVQITDAKPDEFVPVSPTRVLGDPAANPGGLGEVDLTFVVPGSTTPASVDFVSLFVIDAEQTGARVTAFDALGATVFDQSYNAGGASQTLVTIAAPQVARVHVTLGQGADTSAIDNIRYTNPRALPPDLDVTGLSGPSAVTPGQVVTGTWTVRNAGGTAIDASSSWTDAVYLSPTPTFNPATALLLGTAGRTGPIAPGESYTGSLTYTVPASAPVGTGYVFVVADSDGQLAELSDANNASDPLTVAVALPDLAVPATAAPDYAAPGYPMRVGWTTRNASATVPAVAAWTDRVYLSTDATLDAGDVELHAEPAGSRSPLAAGAEFAPDPVVTLPAGTAAGNYFLLFAADAGNVQGEANEANNVASRPITVGATPPIYWTDWVSGTAGTAGAATGVLDVGGTRVDVSYSGEIAFIQTNGGTNYWSPSAPYRSAPVPNAPPPPDIIALSRASSKTLTFSQPIADVLFAVVSLNGNGYRFDRDFEILSQGGGYFGNGSFSRSVVTENGQTFYQLNGSGEPHGVIRFKGAYSTITWTSLTNEYWNGFTIGVASLALPDLTAAVDAAPAAVGPGQAVPVRWTVTNLGRVPAVADWTDRVYLSADATLDAGDVPIGAVSAADHSPLAPDGTYTVDGTATIPAGAAPGNYHLLVVADDGNAQVEVTDLNNVASRPITVEVAPAVTAHSPSGHTRGPVSGMTLDLSAPVVGAAARLPGSYQLVDLGADGVPGGGDDQVLPVAPSYVDGSRQINLLFTGDAPADLSTWVERDYSNGAAGDWRLQPDGSVKQFANAAPTFFVSDFDFIDRTFTGRLRVEETNGDDDLIGLAFGFTAGANGRPDSYYYLSWKQANQGNAEAGLKLLRVSNASGLTQGTIDNLLFDGEAATSGAAQIQVLARNTGANSLGWQDNVQYDFTVTYTSAGAIGVAIRRTDDGQLVWQANVVDPSPLGVGKVGFMNHSQPMVRYSGIRQAAFLPDGAYQLTAFSGAPGLGSASGVPLDGNNDGNAGDPFVTTLVVDTTAPVVSGAAIAADAVTVDFFDRGGLDPATAGNPAHYTIVRSGGDGLFGNGNDVAVAVAGASYAPGAAGNGRATLTFASALPDDLYRLTVDGTAGIADLAGNLLDGDQSRTLGLDAVPATISVRLNAASDSGVSAEDGVTNAATPNFDVTINEAGTVSVDVNGDGTVDGSQFFPAAGTYIVPAPAALGEATYTIAATLTPAAGLPASGSYAFTIDRTGPALSPIGGAEPPPLSSRPARFTEAVFGVSTASIALTGPSGAIPIASASGSGTDYTLGFSSQVTPGTYTVSASSTITDRAGNPLNPAVTDSFTLLADTTPPRVVSFAPTGLRNADVSEFLVVFSEAIDASTFTGADVALDGPSGPVPSSGFVVSPVDDRTFRVAIPNQSAEGGYQVTVGPNIEDLSGNAMQGGGPTGPNLILNEGFELPDVSGSFVTYSTAPAGFAWTIAGGPIDLVNEFWQGTSGVVNPDGRDQSIDIDHGSRVVQDFATIPGQTYRLLIDYARNSAAGNASSIGSVQIEGDGLILRQNLSHDLPATPSSMNWQTFVVEFTANSTTTRLTLRGDAANGIAGFAFDHARVFALSSSGGYQAAFTIDKTGPLVTAVSPSGTTNAVVNAIDVTFGEPIDASTLASADIVLTGPGGGAIAVGAPSALGGNTYRFPIAPQRANGVYSVTIGPAVADAVGNPMAAAHAASFTVALPDLEVDPFAPPSGSATFGQAIDLGWVVRNAGTATASAWTDRVYLSADPALSAEDVLLGSFASEATLAAGGTLARTGPVTPPLAANLPPGNYYLIVVTDALGAVVESDDGDNVRATATPIALSLPPLPDLVPIAVAGPATGLPGDTVTVTYETRNAGAVPAGGSWLERVYLSDDAAVGGDLLVGAFNVTAQEIASGTSAARSRQVQLPGSLAPGNWHFVVEIDPLGAVVEENEGNNAAVSAAATVVPVRLTVTASASGVAEDGAPITGRVTRTGGTASALVVTLASSDATEATVPASVTIPAGASFVEFAITPQQDNLLDGDQPATISARVLDADGDPVPGFAGGSTTISVRDSARPAITLTLSAAEVVEGGAITGTLTRSPASIGTAVTVALAPDLPGQLLFPASVTIPAGQLSADFVIEGRVDPRVEVARVVTLTATGFGTASAGVRVIDANDASLVVTTAAVEVPEQAVGVVTIGTVTRPVVTNQPMLVRLQADAGRLIVPASVVIPANQASAQFQIATVDNLVSGDTAVVTIQANPVDPVDGTSLVAPGGSTGLRVVDDDGPTLSVTIRDGLISEGDNVPPRDQIPAALGVVRRNTADTSSPLIVTLRSSDPTEALVRGDSGAPAASATLTIPAGASSAEFGIFAVRDNITDGVQVVTISAQSAGFNEGRGLIAVGDIDQPDLRVVDLSAPASALSGQSVTLRYTLFNQGTEPALPSWFDRIYLSSDAVLDYANDTLLATRIQGVTVGGQGRFNVAVAVTLPDSAIGNFYLLVETDATRVVTEVFEENNVGHTPQPIAVSAAYSATVAAAVDRAVMGTPVTLSGSATRVDTGGPASGVPVSVRVLHESGVRRVLQATTDADGNYSVTFTPLPGEAGDYRVAAAHPGVRDDVVQDTFTLIGMRVQPPGLATRLVEGQQATGTFAVANLSDVPLTGLSWSVVETLPGNLQVEITPPSLGTLPGRASADFTYTIRALDASTRTANLTLRLASAEGVVVLVPLTVRVEPLTASLQGPARVASAMLLDRLTPVEFTITNNGGAATGPIQVLLPPGTPWLTAANAPIVGGVPTLPSIAPGGSATVSLLLNPGTSLPLGPYSGNFVLVPQSGQALSINYAFDAVSDAEGDLEVQVYNELVDLETGAPFRVAGAEVALVDVFNGAVIRVATTGPDGTVLLGDVPEGHYNLRVRAEGHDASVGTILVEPGMINRQVVVLRSRQVTYNWTVVPVPFEDRYQVVIESVFATNVPAPVITITPGLIDLKDPQFADGVGQVDFTIANHGLVAAQGMTFTFDAHPLWSVTPLISDIGTLPARSELVVPAIVRLISAPGGGDDGACSFNGSLDWHVVSFGREIPFSITVPVLNSNDECGTNVYIPPPSGGGGGGGGEFGGGGGGSIILPGGTSPRFNFETPVEVDAAVRLRIEQEAVMTRTAFDATLEISNGLSGPLEGLQVELFVVDVATGLGVDDRFAISEATLSNILVDGSGLWTVPARSTGSARWTLLPTDLAAPDGPTSYDVGGVFSYLVDGRRVTTPMTPARIVVHPDAALDVKYFFERNVYSDDPFTPQVEPSVPFNLGIMVANNGAGAARDLTIVSAQPRIVENEKGLLIDFEIIGSQVGTDAVSPSLELSFGDIAPGEVEVGRWQFLSSLQGQFIDYQASFEHLTGLGDPRTSLIKSLQIFELIHVVRDARAGADALADFLTNEVDDGPLDLPDTVHLTDGSVRPVGLGRVLAAPAAPAPGALEVAVQVEMPAGFGYLRIADVNPDRALYRLGGVRRPDGSTLEFGTNVWTTDRTFTVPFQRPIVEDLIHLFDHGGPGSYTLVYVPLDQAGPTVSEVEQVAPDPTTAAVDGLVVTFSEAIAPGTFTPADLTLTRDGAALALDGATITPVDASNRAFRVGNLAGLTGTDGLYVLTIDPAGVTDVWGNPGTGPAAVRWVRATESVAVAAVTGVPSGPTNIPPTRIRVEFTGPVDASTFGLDAVSLRRDGGADLLTPDSGADVLQVGPGAFEVVVPFDLVDVDGSYELTVDATAVRDPSGKAGVGQVGRSWTLDTRAPALLPIEAIPTNPRNIVVPTVRVRFDSPIDPATFDWTKVRLTRDGGTTNLLDARFDIIPLSPTEFRLVGQSWPQSVEGLYTLTVDAAGILDAAGNPATGVQSVSWRLDLTPPAAPVGFGITPDRGSSAADLLTNTGTLALTGTAAEPGGRVKFFDDLTGTDLGFVLLGDGRAFSLPVTLSAGSHRILAVHVDDAGNFSPAGSFVVVVDQTPPTLASVAPVSPDPRPTAVGSIDFVLSEPIDPATFNPAAVQLSRNGVPVAVGSSPTLTHLGGSSYRLGNLAGLTGLDGNYLLSLPLSGLADAAGNAGLGTVTVSWLKASAPATVAATTVSPLPRRQSTLNFEVSVAISPPSGGASPTSAVRTVDLYVSVDGGPFSYWTTVAASDPRAIYPGQSDRRYSFHSVGRDAAGNFEAKAPNTVEATTYVPDLSPPATAVTAVDARTPSFVISVEGNDAGGSGLSAFQVFVEVDGGAPQLVATIPAGAADASGTYRRSLSYAAIVDGSPHAYRFYSRGVDGLGNVEAAPAAPADVRLDGVRFEEPARLELLGFDVQRGLTQRSYVRYVGLSFNLGGQPLQGLVASLADADPANDRIRLAQHDLDGNFLRYVPLTPAMLTVLDRAIELDFGAGGVGSNGVAAARNQNVGDGYYRVDLDLDGDPSAFEASRRFYRLLGDVNGDRVVSQLDINLIALAMLTSSAEQDVNGDGSVTVADRSLAQFALNRRLKSGLTIDD